jgi:Flp pilus assembly protein TadG
MSINEFCVILRTRRPGPKRGRDGRSGQALVLLTLMISTLLVPIVGLAIDGGRGYLVKVKLSTAVDGASLAAGRLMGTPPGASVATQTSYTVAAAQQYLAANFPTGFFAAKLVGSGTVCVDPGTNNSDPCHVGNGGQLQTYKIRTVSVQATATMPTFFMRLLNMPTVTVNAVGVAQRRDVRVVLAIDRSSSMSHFYGTGGNCSSPPCIQAMLNQFVNSFSGAGELGGRDEVGLVVFGGSGIVAYPARSISNDFTDYTQFTPPDNNFKTRSSTIINEITSQTNTGTAEALYLAYMTLRADAATNTDLASKLNVIVLFTDGLPNGVTAFANDPSQIAKHSGQTHFMIPSGSCTFGSGSWGASNVVTSSSNLVGWFAQWNSFSNSNSNAHGFFKNMMAYSQSGHTGNTDIDDWMKNGEGTSPQWTSDSCPSTTMPSGTLTQFPDYDLFGNYTTLDNAPAVNGLKPPKAPGNKSLYTLGSLYSNQCGSSTYNPAATSNACQIGLASWQAAVHQGWKIWNQVIWSKASQQNIVDPAPNLAAPVIFTLGFDDSKITGGEAPDLNMLQLIANDPNSPAPFSNRVNGHAYIASDPNSVGLAFQQIRSQILRLAQ